MSRGATQLSRSELIFNGGTQGCDVQGTFTEMGNQLQLAVTGNDEGVECSNMALLIGGFHGFEFLHAGMFYLYWDDTDRSDVAGRSQFDDD